MSFDFNETYYLKSKLQQLIKTDAATYGSWSTNDVKDAIEAAGMTVQDHCNQYSLVEGTSANPYFNTTEYLEAKLAQLKSVDPTQYSTWTVADVVKAFQDAGFTSAEDHYNQYGCKETDATGHLINPSNAFDANAYVQAKLAQLVAADPETYGEWTAADVAEAIAEAGMSPVEHFEEYGKAEGQAAGIDMVQTVPVTQRVANDELRDGMNENVPSNYNKPVDAPKDVDASEAGSVDKPCDMANATNKPADPVAVPGDSGYVDVPGGGIEDKPGAEVTLVTAEVKDNTGKVIDTETQYGVASTETKDGVTTTTVKGVDATGAVTEDTIQTVTTDPAKGTTTTETKLTDSDGNTLEVKEEVTTASDGTTTTKTEATATDATGKQTAKTESTETQASDGTTTSDVKYTDADGKTTETTTDAEGNTETKDVTDDDNGGGSSGGAGTGTGTPDGVGPVIKSVAFAKDDDGNDIPTQFVLTFDENVKDAGIKYSANGGADADVTSAVVDGKTVTVTVSTLKAGDSVVFKVGAGVTDSLGNNSKDQTSDALTVPATGTLTATGGTTLTVEGKTENAVVIDDAGFTVQDGTKAVTPDGVFDANTKTIDVKGVQAASITIDGVPATTTEIDTSDLTVTTVNLTPGTQALTIGGTATKAANTVVTGLAANGSVTGTGAFTVGNGGLEVTHAKVTATDATTLTLTTENDTVVKGAVAGAMTGATAFVVSGTNKIDLTGITDLGASVKTLNISNIATEAKVTSDQLAGLTTVTGKDEHDILVVAGKATVDAAKLGAYTVKSEQNGGTIEVSADATITGANIDDSFTGLTVASGKTATLDADALTQFTAAKTSIGGEGTITTAAKAVSLGAGTVDLAKGTLGLADGATLTAADALNLGILDLSAADSFTLATGTGTTAKDVTIGTLTGKDNSGPATAVTVTGEGTVTVATAMSNVTSITGDEAANTFVIKGQDGLAVDMAAEADSLTLDVAGLTLTGGISVTMGAGEDNLSLSGTHTGGVKVNLGVSSDASDSTKLGDNADTISGFVAGASGDKLVFAKGSVDAISAVGALADLTADDATDFKVTVANANIIKTANGTLNAVTVGAAGTDANAAEVVMADSAKAYILTTAGASSDGSTTYNVYNVQTNTTATIDLVGVVTVTGELHADNFGVATA